MANRYIEAMLPPVPDLGGRPEALEEYLVALDDIAGAQVLLRDLARARAAALRPVAEDLRRRLVDRVPGGLVRPEDPPVVAEVAPVLEPGRLPPLRGRGAGPAIDRT